MKIQTTEPAKNDEFNLFSDFSPKNQTSPPSFIPGMSDQPPQTQPQAAAIDPFQPNPVQQVRVFDHIVQNVSNCVYFFPAIFCSIGKMYYSFPNLLETMRKCRF